MNEKECPKCGARRLTEWHELSDEQKFLVERLPENTRYTPAQRKKHRFCTRCFHESANEPRTV